MNASIRKTILAQRQKISEHVQIAASHQVAETVWNLDIFHQAKRIGLYFSIRGEIKTEEIIEKLRHFNKEMYFPRLEKNTKQLKFYRYHSDEALQKNGFGIPEPAPILENEIPVERLEIVLVPMVAFTEQCDRLGMGAGYYDRTFAWMKENLQHRPMLIGLAYESQKIEKFDLHHGDVPMDIIITESSIFKRKK